MGEQNRFNIRRVENADAAEILAIYEPYVLSTAITFEYDVPTVEEIKKRIADHTAEYPWLVCTFDDKVIGYAYAHRHRPRAAYQWSPESSIYLSKDFHGKGIARVLYSTLFSILRLQGHVNVFAGVLIPNDRSERLHRSLGFEHIGDFRNVGYKLGSWHTVRWFQLQFREHLLNPPMPKPIGEVASNKEYREILDLANEQLRDHSTTL
jgi:phosphinothricin acetyltransferase